MMRIKVVEILKFIVAVAIGFTIRVMFETSENVLKQPKPCDITKYPISDLSLDNIHEQLRQPHQPSSIIDLIEYRYFNLSVVFDTHLGYLQRQMKQYHRSDIRDMIRQAETLLNAGVNIRYKTKNIINGFERIDPVRGKEYILDLELIPESNIKVAFKPRTVRLHLVKPFSYVQLNQNIEVSSSKSKTINMLYIVNGSNSNFIKYILAHHEKHIINLFPVNVTIYLCSESPSPKRISLDIDAFSVKYKSVPSYKISLLVNDSCRFQAPEVVNKVVQSISDENSRMVILDINVNVTHQFLQRCSNALSTSPDIVYVPIPFARFLHQTKIYEEDTLSEESGIWDHENFEVVCMYKRLFSEAKGLNKDDFSPDAYKSIINHLIQMKKQIFRSTDPSVSVFYHNLNCKDQESMKYFTRQNCEDRQRRTFQSQMQTMNLIKLD